MSKVPAIGLAIAMLTLLTGCASSEDKARAQAAAEITLRTETFTSQYSELLQQADSVDTAVEAAPALATTLVGLSTTELAEYGSGSMTGIVSAERQGELVVAEIVIMSRSNSGGTDGYSDVTLFACGTFSGELGATAEEIVVTSHACPDDLETMTRPEVFREEVELSTHRR